MKHKVWVRGIQTEADTHFQRAAKSKQGWLWGVKREDTVEFWRQVSIYTPQVIEGLNSAVTGLLFLPGGDAVVVYSAPLAWRIWQASYSVSDDHLRPDILEKEIQKAKAWWFNDLGPKSPAWTGVDSVHF